MAARKPSPRVASAAHLIVGADSYLRTRQREEIIAATVPEEGRPFAVEQVSLARTPLGQALVRAAMRPMLSPRQVLVLSDFEAVPDKDWAELEKYLAAPADFTVLVFEAEKLDRRTRAARLLEKNCKSHKAEPADDKAAEAAAAEFARELGMELDRTTGEDLVFVLGTDQGRLRKELEKLRAYVGPGGEVQRSDIAELVRPARQFNVFDLGGLLVEGRRADALVRLRRLLEKGANPIGIVGALAWLYRQLLTAQALPRDTPVWKAAQFLRAPRWRVPELLRQARKVRPEELRSAFAVLQEADVALKSSPPNPAAVLETVVVRLTSGQAATSGATPEFNKRA